MKLPPLKEFMNTTDELHSFVIGFFEVICPWRPSTDKEKCGEGLLKAISAEYHYYLFGRGMAVVAWLIIAKIIQVVFF